jgi:hypothetical protein
MHSPPVNDESHVAENMDAERPSKCSHAEHGNKANMVGLCVRIYSTVTLFAKFLGLSTSQPRATAM